MIEYKTVARETVESIDIIVNEHLQDGWELHGDLKFVNERSDHHYFIQSMVKITQNPKE